MSHFFNKSKIIDIEYPVIGIDLLTLDCISLIHYFRVPLVQKRSNLELYKTHPASTKEGPENCL